MAEWFPPCSPAVSSERGRFLERCRTVHIWRKVLAASRAFSTSGPDDPCFIPAENRAALGIDDGLVRLSVGVENVDDLIDRLFDQAARIITSSLTGSKLLDAAGGSPPRCAKPRGRFVWPHRQLGRIADHHPAVGGPLGQAVAPP